MKCNCAGYVTNRLLNYSFSRCIRSVTGCFFDMAEEIVVTPWASDSEWQSVRQDIYANKETRNYSRALRRLLLWKTRKGSLSRGLYCTELILQVITKDIHFCNVDDVINENDLVRLYSMAIMKFVNLTADVSGKGPQKSMYYRASRIELPSWLIDMRHKISHDQDLPSLESLRTAIEFTLEWLQSKYWNDEDNFLVVVPKFNMYIVDKFIDVLEFYTLNNTQTNTVLKEDRLNILRNKLSMLVFSNKECIKKMIKLLAIKDWSSQLVNVFVTQYLLQAQECNVFKGRISKKDKETWSVLLKNMTISGLLTNILQCLVTQNSHIAALWVVELCIIVYKESKRNDVKHKNENDNCLNFKPICLDTSLILRTALNSTHAYTITFLKWLLKIQLNPLKKKQKYDIVKLVSLYTGSVKITSKNTDTIFSVNDLIKKTENKHQTQWSKAFDMNWRQIPLGTTL